MKKIAVFHPSSELYGADRILVLALQSMLDYQPVIYLPKNGPLVQFIERNLPDAMVKISMNMPLFYRDLKKPSKLVRFFKQYRAFKRLMKSEFSKYKFDQVYINTLACSPIAYMLKDLTIQKLIHVHEIIDNPKLARKLTSKIALKHCNKVICVSSPVAENLLKSESRYAHKVKVVHNGINPVHVNVKEPDNKKVQFYLFGRIKPEKGQWFLLEALQLIDKDLLRQANFNLVGSTLAGKEFLLDELRSEIEKNHLHDVINHIPFVNDISSELAKADVCLIPSQMRDPFPTTVLEAMSAGKAVIATNHGGAVEAVKNMQSGFLIDPDSPEALAEKISAFIQNRNMAFGMGLNGKRIFNKNFTLDAFKTRWLKAVA
ncbi:MAG: glycosyltransferase family 4 protein [Crocinitomicaceae bacterium]|nr:glycosyltransferase family 4 protein [Crocinitomicaceae bacterium]